MHLSEIGNQQWILGGGNCTDRALLGEGGGNNKKLIKEEDEYGCKINVFDLCKKYMILQRATNYSLQMERKRQWCEVFCKIWYSWNKDIHGIKKHLDSTMGKAKTVHWFAEDFCFAVASWQFKTTIIVSCENKEWSTRKKLKAHCKGRETFDTDTFAHIIHSDRLHIDVSKTLLKNHCTNVTHPINHWRQHELYLL